MNWTISYDSINNEIVIWFEHGKLYLNNVTPKQLKDISADFRKAATMLLNSGPRA